MYAFNGQSEEFGISTKGIYNVLSPHCIVFDQQILRKLIKEIGEDPKQYSSHSFRRGGATWAFSSNIPSELIQLYSDWSSDAYKTYLKFSLKDKISVAIKMKDHILDI
jgi:integrase